MYKIVVKLKRIKCPLKEWNRKENMWSFKNLDRNLDKLQQAEQKMVDDPNNESRMIHYEWLLKEREKILLFNQDFWGKLSRKEWLTKGDRNSSYFHRNLSARKKRNKIGRIKDRNGTWIDDEKLLNDHFIEKYEKRFKAKYIIQKISRLKSSRNILKQ